RRDHGSAVVRRADVDGQHRGNAERAVAARRAEWSVPDGPAGGQFDGADAAIGGLLAQHAGEAHAPAGVDVDGVGHAPLRVPGPLGAFGRPAARAGGLLLQPRVAAREPAAFVGLLARDQPVVIGHVVVVGDDHAAGGIDGDAAPVGPTIVARVLDPAAVAGRRGVHAL